MHASVLAWVGRMVGAHNLAERSTLEVGSFDVNGTVRPLFAGAYVGADMRPGPGVDEVALASALPFADKAFEVVVSTEMLEHDPLPWQSIPEMARVLAPGGHLLLTARGVGFPIHEHPADYWRFTTSGLGVLLASADLSVVELVEDPEASGVFALAVKPT